METSSLAIDLQNVSRTYMMGDTEVQALQDVSLQVKKGEFVSIVGFSGAGKSTLLRIIGCIEKPTAGKAIVGGYNTTELSQRELTLLRRKLVGTVFQHFALIPSLSVEKNVELPLLLAKVEKKKRLQRVKELLELVGLSHRYSFFPEKLSGGEKQRVAIARALANQPEILLADEPTGSLDLHTAKRIITLFKRINREQGQTIVMVTHDRLFAEYTDRVISMEGGRIVSITKGKHATEKLIDDTLKA